MSEHVQPGVAQIRTESATPSYNPQSAITIAVDTAYVVAQGGGSVNAGIYMFDNRLTNGSSAEGNMELRSRVNLGDLVGFDVVPINPNLNDTVSITGFNISSGSVFGSQGYPISASADNSYWVGQAVNAGPPMTYQIQILVQTGGIRPTNYYVTWDPFISTV